MIPPRPPLILTRPPAQALHWAQALDELGVPTLALPLMAIEAKCDPATLQAKEAIVARLAHYHAIMHVSPNAVQYFWDLTAQRAWQEASAAGQAPRLWSPGPGTTRSLLALGFAQDTIDQPDLARSSQFDSEALWHTVHTQISGGARVLIVRGSTHGALPNAVQSPDAGLEGNGRLWLSRTLQQHGAVVELLSVYERRAPAWQTSHLTIVDLAAQGACIWLFNSSEAVEQLTERFPKHNWRSHSAIATHPRIGQTLLDKGFAKVLHCLPTPEALAQTWTAAIQSL
ncbi:uroporphyrinogen-III synthase [Lampropedia aestuarii]|uniref:uroporphyrinogen-III synthase n=1 Tax=Lampropedia aestuarii TaxID=2562762 RepID=UPI0014562274|nr:uroporphyrinogen-III synthase [Lampropedia aestuarii]